MTSFKNPKFFLNSEGKSYSSYDGRPWQPSDKPLTKAEGEKMERAQAIAHLKTLVKPGDTVQTVLRHKSASGMSRSISCFVARDSELIKLDYWIAEAGIAKFEQKHGGLKMGGCGMDMGFALVYNMGRMLWPSGTEAPHGSRNGKPDTDGGYALKQEWI